MPVQFPYPESDWAVGEMRTRRNAEPISAAQEAFGDKPYSAMPEGEWQQLFNQLPSGKQFLVGPSGKLDSRSIGQGVTAPENHPGIKGLSQEDYEIRTIPEMEGYVHIRPKGTPVAAADIRTATSTVVEGIKQSRGKRTEAEAK